MLSCVLSPSPDDDHCFHILVGFYFGMECVGFGRKKRQYISEEGKPFLKSYQSRVSKKLRGGDLLDAEGTGIGSHPEWLPLVLEEAIDFWFCNCTDHCAGGRVLLARYCTSDQETLT